MVALHTTCHITLEPSINSKSSSRHWFHHQGTHLTDGHVARAMDVVWAAGGPRGALKEVCGQAARAASKDRELSSEGQHDSASPAKHAQEMQLVA